jgi:two-component system sensor histidine kinase ChvG
LPVGRLAADFPDTEAADELGDVSRSFSLLLTRLDEYTHYLRTLAGKLAHEIRTPLAIMRSSLDNLETEPVSEAARTYLARAREGSERLHGILTAMGAASRVEESIQSAERISFDLAAMLRDAIGAYRMTFARHEFVLVGAEQSCTIDGAPDLVMQMLDKLVDNAIDFSTPGTPITITLVREDSDTAWAAISVENLGPPLPANADSRLFESLWQSRTDSDARPHFGLGLYIVRLIAEFHGGNALAETLDGERGARFTVRLRRHRSQN